MTEKCIRQKLHHCERVCVIFAAGEYFGVVPEIPDGAYVIAADGGFDVCVRHHVHVDMVMGDFDSITRTIPLETARFQVPAEKDLTDTASAVTLGWEHGCRVFHIYGSLGGRLDHSIANMQLVAGISQHGGIGFLHSGDVKVTAITDGSLTFPAFAAPERTMISVFSHADSSEHIDERGLKYFLDDAQLSNLRASGVSNEFVNNRQASVSVGSGTLLVTFASIAPLPVWTTTLNQKATFDTISTHVTPALNILGNNGAQSV